MANNFKLSKFNLIIQEDTDKTTIFNTLSGSVSRFNNFVWHELNTNIINEQTIYFDELLKQGFIVSDKINETEKILLKEKIETLSFNSDILNIVIAPTLLCNLKCFYCFESNSSIETGIINNKTIDSIIQFIDNKLIEPIKELHIRWFGGEPMLAYDAILLLSEKAISICNKKNIIFSSSMITNGTLLTRDKADILFKQCALKNIQITMDGTEAEYCKRKYATPQQYNDTLDNIVYCSNLFSLKIRLNYDKDNYQDLLTLTDILLQERKLVSKITIYLAEIKDYNQKGIDVPCLNEHEDFLSKYNDYLRLNYPTQSLPKTSTKSKRIFCGLKKISSYAIGHLGELYTCEHDFGVPEKIIGDINNGLYYNTYYREFMKLTLSNKCTNCKLLPLCLGGCPSVRYNTKKEDCLFSEQYIKKVILDILKNREKKNGSTN